VRPVPFEGFGQPGRVIMKGVGLTWHNPNSLVLVEGPEIAIQPVGIRRLPSEVAQVKRHGGDA
jgi:hypothetical protein